MCKNLNLILKNSNLISNPIKNVKLILQQGQPNCTYVSLFIMWVQRELSTGCKVDDFKAVKIAQWVQTNYQVVLQCP